MRRYVNTSLIVLLVLVVGACGSSPSIGQVTSTGTQTTINQITQPTSTEARVATTTPAAAPAGTSPTTTPQSTVAPTSSASATPAQINVLDIHALPLGDGKVSTSPKNRLRLFLSNTIQGRGSRPYRFVDSW